MNKLFLLTSFLLLWAVLPAADNNCSPCCGQTCTEESRDTEEKQCRCRAEAAIGDTVICPVMKEKITVNEKTLKVKIGNKNYYICCESCRDELLKNPDKYLSCEKCPDTKKEKN